MRSLMILDHQVYSTDEPTSPTRLAASRWPSHLLRLELTATSSDVDTATLAHRAWQSGILNDLLESPHTRFVRRLPVEVLSRIERNEIHMRIHAL